MRTPKQIMKMLGYTEDDWVYPCHDDGVDACHCGFIFTEPDESCICKVMNNDPLLEDYEHLEETITIHEMNMNAMLICASKDMLLTLLKRAEFILRTGGSIFDWPSRAPVEKATGMTIKRLFYFDGDPDER